MLYLSIDLDYWAYRQRRDVDSFFKQVFALKLPVFCVAYHHHLLDHINQAKYDKIINVDYHADICDDGPGLALNEGVWANYVTHKDTYVWRYPSEECLSHATGYCHDDTSPFEQPAVAGWNDTEKKLGLRGIPWQEVTAVGVCLSKYWLYGRYTQLANVLKRLKMTMWLHAYQSEIQPRFVP